MNTLRSFSNGIKDAIFTALVIGALMTTAAGVNAHAADNPIPQGGCNPYICDTYGTMCDCAAR